MKYSIILGAVFIILQILDVLTTIKALNKPGIVEGNPILNPLMEKIGVLPTLIIVKVFTIAATIAGLYYYPLPIVQIVTAATCLVYIWVIWNNIQKAK